MCLKRILFSLSSLSFSCSPLSKNFPSDEKKSKKGLYDLREEWPKLFKIFSLSAREVHSKKVSHS